MRQSFTTTPNTTGSSPEDAYRNKLTLELNQRHDRDGWIRIDERWTSPAAVAGPPVYYTVAVPGTPSARFSKGIKVKLKRTRSGVTTQCYFYIIGWTDSTSSSTLALCAGTTYDLASGDIIFDVWMSRETSPLNFPERFGYQPTHVGFSSAPGAIATFNLEGVICHLSYYSASGGTSSSATYHASAPISPCLTYGVVSYGECYGIDSGAVVDSFCIADGSAVAGYIQLAKTKAVTAWTATGTKYAHFSISYRIA